MRFDLVTVGRKCATSPTMKERVSRVRVATWLFSSTEDSMSLTASPDKQMKREFEEEEKAIWDSARRGGTGQLRAWKYIMFHHTGKWHASNCEWCN